MTSTVPGMLGRLLAFALAAMVAAGVVPATAQAHGDHDAWPIARQLAAGPYTVSLWQVYPDNGTAMTPVLIVMFDGLPATPASIQVAVTINGIATPVAPATTTPNGLQTAQGLAPGDAVRVSVIDGAQRWELGPVVATPPPTTLLPIEQFLYVSIFLTIATAWWVVSRTARAWRRPVGPSAGGVRAS